jgi:hypothetical protein
MVSTFNRKEFLRLLSCGVASSHLLADGNWTNLIQGDSLAGWHKTGAAVWEVRDGVLTGRQGAASAAGDIYTDLEWTDFELEAEWKMHWPANSGIWFHRTGTTPGYQVDLFDSKHYGDIYSGSVYRMGQEGKGFIGENRDKESVFLDSWNRVRLRVAGDRITVTHNNKLVVDIHDNRFPSGSVGIEVHGGPTFEGMEVSVRNMRVRSI